MVSLHRQSDPRCRRAGRQNACRADAAHTANLRKDARCSVFIQPPNMPARALARVTLIGTAEKLTDDEAAHFAELHLAQHGPGIGVDAASPSDEYWRLNVEQVAPRPRRRDRRWAWWP